LVPSCALGLLDEIRESEGEGKVQRALRMGRSSDDPNGSRARDQVLDKPATSALLFRGVT
jgi:hypothetical protein